jgi:hypothetical protein
MTMGITAAGCALSSKVGDVSPNASVGGSVLMVAMTSLAGHLVSCCDATSIEPTNVDAELVSSAIVRKLMTTRRSRPVKSHLELLAGIQVPG